MSFSFSKLSTESFNSVILSLQKRLSQTHLFSYQCACKSAINLYMFKIHVAIMVDKCLPFETLFCIVQLYILISQKSIKLSQISNLPQRLITNIYKGLPRSSPATHNKIFCYGSKQHPTINIHNEWRKYILIYFL